MLWDEKFGGIAWSADPGEGEVGVHDRRGEADEKRNIRCTLGLPVSGRSVRRVGVIRDLSGSYYKAQIRAGLSVPM